MVDLSIDNGNFSLYILYWLTDKHKTSEEAGKNLVLGPENMNSVVAGNIIKESLSTPHRGTGPLLRRLSGALSATLWS